MTKCDNFLKNGICNCGDETGIYKCPLSAAEQHICKYYKESNVVLRLPTVMEIIVNRDKFETTIVADDKDNRSVTYHTVFDRMDTFPMVSEFMILMPSGVIILKNCGKEDVIGKLK